MENQKHKISPIPEEEERYELIWPGKAAGFRKAYAPLNAKLLPCVEESVNFDGTENLYLEGDSAGLADFIPEAEAEGIEVLHSTPEQFFAQIQPTARVEKSLYISMPGCYVTMSRLKRLHIELENQLYFAEKICSAAAMNGLMVYPAGMLAV